MSNINSLVLEGLGEGIGALAGATGAAWARRLAGLGTGALAPLVGIDPVTGYAVGAGGTTAALNLLKNYSDPIAKYDHAGNILRAIGSGVSGSIPYLGSLVAAYNGGAGSYNILSRQAEMNRHKQLQDQAAQLAMFQQARQGVMPQPYQPQPSDFSLPFFNRQQPDPNNIPPQ